MLCNRCKSIFVRWRDRWPSWPKEGGSTGSSWGDYRYLFEADIRDCQLCKDLRRAFIDQGVGRSTEFPNDMGGEIYSILHSTSLYFSAWKIPPTHESRLEGYRKLNLRSSIDDPLHSVFRDCPLSTDSSSDACFALAKDWMNRCRETHPTCPNKSALLPSRILDVGDNSNEPFLYIPNGEIYGRWLTLSHCWGTYHTIKTTTASIEAHMKCIPLSDLPETFRDAVYITRRVGYQYLWIDSLCIIQDSIEDWEAESGKMASIYLDADLNIAADASTGDNDGIFKSVAAGRPAQVDHLILPCPVPRRLVMKSTDKGWRRLLVATRGRKKIDAEGKLHAVPGKLPRDHDPILELRGWVLQESVLSPRILRYSQGGLQWTCGQSGASEKRPEIVDHSPRRSADVSIHGALFNDSAFNAGDEAAGIAPEHQLGELQLIWWYNKINVFVQRKLKFPKDRFPAILGLANAFSARTGYTFKCGIMIEDFRRGLLWHGPSSQTYMDYYPSWSWAVASEGDSICGNSRPPNDNIYSMTGLQVQGKYFSTSLVNISSCHGYDGTSQNLSVLTLRGYTRSLESFLCGYSGIETFGSHFSDSERDSPSSEPGARARPISFFMARLPGNNMTSTWIRFYLDTPRLLADSLQALEKLKTVALRIGDFSTGVTRGQRSSSWIPWSTYYILLEPLFQSDATVYRRLGIMNVYVGDGQDEPSTIDESLYELKTVQIF